MEQQRKEPYESPTVEIVELKMDGCILQASKDPYAPTPWP